MKPRQTSKRANGQCGPKQPAHHIPGKIHTDTHTQTHTHKHTLCQQKNKQKHLFGTDSKNKHRHRHTHTHTVLVCCLGRASPPHANSNSNKTVAKTTLLPAKPYPSTLKLLILNRLPLYIAGAERLQTKSPRSHCRASNAAEDRPSIHHKNRASV